MLIVFVCGEEKKTRLSKSNIYLLQTIWFNSIYRYHKNLSIWNENIRVVPIVFEQPIYISFSKRFLGYWLVLVLQLQWIVILLMTYICLMLVTKPFSLKEILTHFRVAYYIRSATRTSLKINPHTHIYHTKRRKSPKNCFYITMFSKRNIYLH